MMEDFERLVALCKGDVHLSANNHKANYQTAAEYVADHVANGAEPPKELERMVETDTIYALQIYPETPIGSVTYWGDRPGSLILEALEDLEADAQSAQREGGASK